MAAAAAQGAPPLDTNASSATVGTLQAEAFKRLYPRQFYDRFVSEGIRPDGRALGACRAVSIGVGAAGTADGSALVKVGATTAIAGVRLEVMIPLASAPARGQLAVNVELTPLSSADWRPGRRNAVADAAAALITSVLAGADGGAGGAGAGVLDLAQLCIAAGQAVWALHLDVYVLDAAGCVLDAAMLAALAALRDARVPAVRLTEEGNVERLEGEAGGGGATGRSVESAPLALRGAPVCLTCGVYSMLAGGSEGGAGDAAVGSTGSRRQLLVADPSASEEALMDALISAVVDEDGSVLGEPMRRTDGGCFLLATWRTWAADGAG